METYKQVDHSMIRGSDVYVADNGEVLAALCARGISELAGELEPDDDDEEGWELWPTICGSKLCTCKFADELYSPNFYCATEEQSRLYLEKLKQEGRK